MSYKVTIHIQGAETQSLYGKDRDGLINRGIRRLTDWEPGVGGLYPKCIRVWHKLRDISGNRAQWEQIDEIKYDTLRLDQLVWMNRRIACAVPAKPQPITPLAGSKQPFYHKLELAWTATCDLTPYQKEITKDFEAALQRRFGSVLVTNTLSTELMDAEPGGPKDL